MSSLFGSWSQEMLAGAWGRKTAMGGSQESVWYQTGYHVGDWSLNLLWKLWKPIKNAHLRVTCLKVQGAGLFIHQLLSIIVGRPRPRASIPWHLVGGTGGKGGLQVKRGSSGHEMRCWQLEFVPVSVEEERQGCGWGAGSIGFST